MVLADRCELILEWMNEPYSNNRVKWWRTIIGCKSISVSGQLAYVQTRLRLLVNSPFKISVCFSELNCPLP